MTISSYLVYPEPGALPLVSAELTAIAGCEVQPAENRDLLVLVTEANDEDGQKQLEARLDAVSGIACLAMVGGWTE